VVSPVLPGFAFGSGENGKKRLEKAKNPGNAALFAGFVGFRAKGPAVKTGASAPNLAPCFHREVKSNQRFEVKEGREKEAFYRNLFDFFDFAVKFKAANFNAPSWVKSQKTVPGPTS
jgi:hypothetical protein